MARVYTQRLTKLTRTSLMRLFRESNRHLHVQLTEKDARKFVSLAERARGNGKAAESVLEALNTALEAHGIEAIRGEEFRGGYAGDLVADYVNMGDTYNTTVIYDLVADEWYVTTFGDFVEKFTDEYRIL